mmetsp:Transcript_133188/g.385350  ORF Transcript_133188/g.385350 Transcript_133188/m.385350 type:complete len:229 (+) Transcript_133188:383-1069(+)
MAKPQVKTCHLRCNTNWPMRSPSETKWRMGRRAKGSCTDCKMFSHWFTVLLRLGRSEVSSATTTAGPRAMARVIKVRSQIGTCHSRKPSMTYCPAKVPVMVDAWPAARMPKAKSFSPRLPLLPKSVRKASPPSSRPISPQNPARPPSLVHRAAPVDAAVGTHAKGPPAASAQSSVKNPLAKEESSATLIKNEMIKATALSTMLYLFAWRTWISSPRSTLRLCTKALCK